MREFSLFFNGDMLGWEEFMPVDGLVDTNSAQAVETIQFDVRGKDMHGVVTVRDRDEKVKDVSFIFLIPFWCPTFPLPLLVPLVSVFGPVFVGFFHVSRICLMFCQFVVSLFEGLELLLIVVANFLIFVHNSSQSVCNEEEFLPPQVPMSFESGVHRLGRELELTEFLRDGCNGGRDGEGLLTVDHRSLSCQPNWERFSSVHVNCEARGSGRGDVCRVGRGYIREDRMVALIFT